MHPTVVINVVGLTGALLGENTPNLNALGGDGIQRPLQTITPTLLPVPFNPPF